MITGQAIELMFDAESEGVLAAAWSAVAAGVDLVEPGGRPHVSLAVFRPPVAVEALETCAEAFARTLPAFGLAFGAVETFPGDEGVVYLSPSPNPDLRESHRRLFHLLDEAGLEADAWYRPDRWVPHCTMASGVPPGRIGDVMSRLRAGEPFGPVRVEGVQLVEFRPVRSLAIHHLGSG